MIGVFEISLVYEENNEIVDKALDEFYERGKWKNGSISELTELTKKVVVRPYLKMELYSELASAHRLHDNPELMIQYAIKGIESAKELDEKGYVGWNYVTLGGSFIFLGDYETAKEIVTKMFDISQEGDADHKWIQETANIYMAEICVNTSENEAVREYLKESYKYTDDTFDDYQEMLDKRKVLEARSYVNEGNYDIALQILKTVDINALQTNERFRSVIVPYVAAMGEIEAKKGNLRNSIQYTEDILNICEEQNMKFHELQYLKRILPIYFAKDPDVALRYQERFFDDYAILIAENNSVTSKFILKTYEDMYEGKKHSEREGIAAVVASVALVLTLLMSYLLVKAEYLSRVDSLTKAYNRRHYSKVYSRFKSNGEEFAAIIMDLDFFKKINDEFGHNVGDQVLIEFSAQVINLMDSNKHFFRMGGEEFCVIMKEADMEQAVSLAEKIRTQFEKTKFNFARTVTVSIGVALSTEREDCYKLADDRLYLAKRTGRNRVISEGEIEGYKQGHLEDLCNIVCNI